MEPQIQFHLFGDPKWNSPWNCGVTDKFLIEILVNNNSGVTFEPTLENILEWDKTKVIDTTKCATHLCSLKMKNKKVNRKYACGSFWHQDGPTRTINKFGSSFTKKTLSLHVMGRSCPQSNIFMWEYALISNPTTVLRNYHSKVKQNLPQDAQAIPTMDGKQKNLTLESELTQNQTFLNQVPEEEDLDEARLKWVQSVVENIVFPSEITDYGDKPFLESQVKPKKRRIEELLQEINEFDHEEMVEFEFQFEELKKHKH
jgi:hypothetical protein